MIGKALALLLSDNPFRQVSFVSNQHYHDIRIGLLLDVFQPSLYVVECFFSSDVINDDCSARSSVVSTSPTTNTPLLWIGTALARLKIETCLPVSQICAFTLSPFLRVTVLVANSTPIVGTGFRGSTPFTYLFSKWVLPTPVSPTRMTT